MPQAASSRTVVQEVEVPDAAGPIECKVTATAAGQSQSTSVTVGPQRKWRVYLAASSHTDIGYTHIQPQCAEQHNVNLDDAAKLIERHPDFKWNAEVAWQVENYLASRKSPAIEQFLRLAREGKIGVEALYVNILTGLCSHEEFCRMTYFAHGLHQQYGIPYSSAMIQDVPTCVASTPMILANSGIRYFGDGINDTRAVTFTHMDRQSPCWWEGPDGSRVLMMFVRPSFAYALRMGFHTSLEAARKLTLKHLAEYEARDDYPYDAIFFNGASNDNWPIEPKLPEIVAAWNQKYAFPKIIFCRYAEFFEYIEKHYGDKLPVVRGSGGTYWEDGAGSSARETALCRNAHEAVESAERMLSLASWLRKRGRTSFLHPAKEVRPLSRSGHRRGLAQLPAVRRAHLGGPHGRHPARKRVHQGSVGHQVAIRRGRASPIDRAAGSRKPGAGLAGRDRRRLAGGVEHGQLAADRRGRSRAARRTDDHRPVGPQRPDGQDDVGGRARRAGLRLSRAAVRPRLLAPIAGEGQGVRELPDGTTIESRFYRVTFDPAAGTVVSLVDKELGRELVDHQAPYRLNQYLYVSGGKDSRIVNSKTKPEAPELTVNTSAKATLRPVNLGPLGQRMIVETSAAMTPKLTCEITVWEDVKRIDVVNRLTKTLTYEKEGVYFAFPFAASKPVLRYEEPAAIVRPDNDFLPGACLDWLTVQHFVELEADDAAICWSTPDAPLVCAHDINRGKWQTDYSAANGHLYAYVMNNYWYTNYLAGQGGDFTFRFAITSRRVSPAGSGDPRRSADGQRRLGPVWLGRGQPVAGRRDRAEHHRHVAVPGGQPDRNRRAERTAGRHETGRGGPGPGAAALGSDRPSHDRPRAAAARAVPEGTCGQPGRRAQGVAGGPPVGRGRADPGPRPGHGGAGIGATSSYTARLECVRLTACPSGRVELVGRCDRSAPRMPMALRLNSGRRMHC